MRKQGPARILRFAVICVLLVVVGAILWYFLTHRRPAAVVPPTTEEITEKKVERQEGIEHFDFKGDRIIQARAKRHYAGEDGRYYLEGNVEIRDLGKGKDREILITGEKASYQKDWQDASIEGQATLKYEGLTVTSSYFFYRKADEVMTTDRDVAFSSRKISGRAKRMAYSFREESLHLEEEVEIRLTDETQTETPFTASGDVLNFSRAQKQGQVEGKVAFAFGRSRGRADFLSFALTPDEQYAREFSLKGNATAFLVEESGPAPRGQNPRPAEERQISAAEIDLKAFVDRHKIREFEARGGCLLNSRSADRKETEFRSQKMVALFDRWGRLRRFRVVEEATVVERDENSQVARTISGAAIYIGELGESWKIVAPEEGEARVDSPDSEITAQVITLYPRKKMVYAEGEIKVLLKLRKDKAEAVGFFSNEQPVFITAQEMRYETGSNRLTLRTGVRMWQGKEMLFAENLTVLKDTGEILGEGRVRSLFSHRPKKEEDREERIEFGGEKLSFNPKDNRLVYEEECWLKMTRVGLQSGVIAVALKEKKAEILTISAKGKVVITEEFREGRGEEALYDLEKDTVVLTGNPTIVDKAKGVIEGDKLTFRLGDGRIQVENKERDRSATVIKS